MILRRHISHAQSPYRSNIELRTPLPLQVYSFHRASTDSIMAFPSPQLLNLYLVQPNLKVQTSVPPLCKLHLPSQPMICPQNTLNIPKWLAPDRWSGHEVKRSSTSPPQEPFPPHFFQLLCRSPWSSCPLQLGQILLLQTIPKTSKFLLLNTSKPQPLPSSYVGMYLICHLHYCNPFFSLGWHLQSHPTYMHSVCRHKVHFLSSSLRSTNIHLCRQNY